jgi:hypothetical protein
MKTSTRIRRRFVLTLALTLAAAAVLAGVGQAATSQAGEEQWLKALTIRSEALNRMYGLDGRSTAADTATAAGPAWLQALKIRSEALNELYGLGTSHETEPEYLRALELRGEGMNARYGLGSAQAPEAEYLRALEIRSEAMNARYGLGTAAPRATVAEGGFDWVDAGIGVAAAFGLMLLTGSAAVVLRRRGRLAHIRL